MPLVKQGLEPSLRAGFADVCLEVGPDAPTLCAGWTARDLLVHLVLIEHRWDSWLAVPLGAKVGRIRTTYDKLVERERARPWDESVDRIRTGPKYNPLATQWLRDRMMPREYLIHTEDVRRANGIKVEVSADAQDVAWSRLPGLGKRMFVAPDPYGLVFERPGGETRTLKAGHPAATLKGEPLELLLHIFGRTSVTEVQLTGDPAAVAAAQIKDTSQLQSLPRVDAS